MSARTLQLRPYIIALGHILQKWYSQWWTADESDHRATSCYGSPKVVKGFSDGCHILSCPACVLCSGVVCCCCRFQWWPCALALGFCSSDVSLCVTVGSMHFDSCADPRKNISTSANSFATFSFVSCSCDEQNSFSLEVDRIILGW